MKRLIVPVLGATLLMGSVAAQAAQQLKTQQDKLSYSMGVMTGKAFKAHNIQVSPQAFSMGLNDGVSGNKTLMTDAEIKQTLETYQKQTMQKLQAQLQVQAKENAQKSVAFLAANKSKAGVKTTATGLQYKVLKAGSGKSPTATDTVTVNYEGKLINGQVFDSSYKRGKAATFPVSGVIKGWQEALTMMKPGGLWEIYIPASLAYGEKGAPGVIGPNEMLIFKVNLISIQKKK